MSQSSESTSTKKTTIAPMLSVRNGAKAIDFYKAAFGATESFRMDDESGAVVARLSIEGAEFWLADESPEHQNFSPQTLSGGTVRIILTVEDPDAAFARAVTAGATVVWNMTDEYGWRIGRIVDPFGYHWEIGKPLSEGL
ncbi:MAG TPA: VOC family protein [Edaphobacter sp.]|nr:VOC family protein [Edaphobacter sp.]